MQILRYLNKTNPKPCMKGQTEEDLLQLLLCIGGLITFASIAT